MLHPREIAKTIGNTTANFSAVTYRLLHYRHLEGDEILALTHHRGDFDRKIVLFGTAVCGLITLTIHNIDNSCHHIRKTNPDLNKIYTNTSLTGWGIRWNIDT